jgi:hypothetical protein
MVSTHHIVESFSILGIVLGVAALPVAILGTLFLIVRAVAGL